MSRLGYPQSTAAFDTCARMQTCIGELLTLSATLPCDKPYTRYLTLDATRRDSTRLDADGAREALRALASPSL